jgi:apolipoprotein N-acyltransferase
VLHGQAGHPTRRSGAAPLSRLRLSAGPRAAAAPALAAAGGLALLGAHPPVGWWWLTFLAPALLLTALVVDAQAAAVQGRGVRAARLGGLFGVVAFAPMLTWLILPAGYLGWALLVLVQAAWMALMAALIRPGLERWWLAPATAVAWTGVDAWRAIWPMNGFEWGAIAYAHVEGSWLLPVARLVGGRGITLLTVLISALAFEVVRRTLASTLGSERTELEQALRPSRGPVGALVGVLLVSVLATIEPPAETGTMDVAAIQGNDIRHWEEAEPPDTPAYITTNMRDLTLATVEEDGPPDLVVWPESSIDRDLYSPRGQHLQPLVAEAAESVPHLLAGANLDGPDPAGEFLNTALLFEGGLPDEDRYVKTRLVPFGEYIPMRELFDWFPPLEQIPRDGQPGPPHQTIDVADTRLGVIICFETLFMDVTRGNLLGDGADPAQLLVVITNNASFGDGAQADQHITQTRLRAVETGRWAVHAAISGSSAFVDPRGRAYQQTDLFTQATIRQQLPLVEGRTPFLVIGDVVGIATRGAVALAVLALVGWSWRGRRTAASERPAAPRAMSGAS